MIKINIIIAIAAVFVSAIMGTAIGAIPGDLGRQMVLSSLEMSNPVYPVIDGGYEIHREPVLEEKWTPDYGAFEVQGTLRAETYRIAEIRKNTVYRHSIIKPIFPPSPIKPNMPTLLTPSDGAEITTLTPTFTWSSFIDPAMGTSQVAYQIRIWEAPGPNSLGSSIVLDKEYSGSASSVTPSASDYRSELMNGKWYHWHVRVKNNKGEWSDWAAGTISTYMDFKVVKENTYIYNGDTVLSDELEAVGQVYSGNKVCTATLINERLVLTAAHCVCPIGSTVGCEQRAKFEMKNVFPVDNPNTDRDESITRKDVSISGYVRFHPDYGLKGQGWEDLAVVELDRPINQVALVTPIAVEDPHNTPFVGEIFTLVGFGRTGQNCADLPEGKQKISLPAIESNWAKITFDRNSRYTCKGDSGGPVLNAAGHVVGVHSGNNSEHSISTPTWFSYNWIFGLPIIDVSIEPTNPHEGDTITLHTWVTNIGETAKDFDVIVKVHRYIGLPRLKNTYIIEPDGFLAPGRTMEYMSPVFVADYPGYYNIEIEVIGKSNEIISTFTTPELAVRCQESCI